MSWPTILQVVNTAGLYFFLAFVSWQVSGFDTRIDALAFQLQQTEIVLQRATDRQSDRVSEVAGIIRSPAFCNPNYLSQTKTTISAGTNKIEVPGPGGIISAGSIFNISSDVKKP